MPTLEEQYQAKCRYYSDIHEHLPTLRKYASECLHVTECGVRTVVSSYAFATALKGKPGHHLVLVDPERSHQVAHFMSECVEEKVDFTFYEQSDLECPLAPTDLLFIDTWHVYGQLKRELERWHSSVRKYIIMHDTTVDGINGETIRNGWDAAEQSRRFGIPVSEILKGLWPAVEEFLAAHPEWRLRERFHNNNGLTVLERV